jgi:hypothetical protein
MSKPCRECGFEFEPPEDTEPDSAETFYCVPCYEAIFLDDIDREEMHRAWGEE